MRAFIVGNGPSLKDTDLDLLIGEAAFACNRISLIYPETKWRPTYYCRAEEIDQKDPEDYHADILEHLGLGCEVWANLWFTKRANIDGVHTIKSCAHRFEHFDHVDVPHQWHLPLLCNFGSTVNVMIQLAVQKGYKPIYLIGCDLGYEDGGNNHFTPDYEKGLGETRPARYANLDTLCAHMIAARSSPVKIYNATVGGSLEVYERKDYYDLFSQKILQ